MPTLHLFFSHKLTDIQEKEAIEVLNCNAIKPLPDKLLLHWKQIPPVGEIDDDLLSKFKDYLLTNSSAGDFVLVQGEFGVTFNIVNWCLHNKRIPVYATTKRVAVEKKQPDGSVKKITIFKHVQFRRYND